MKALEFDGKSLRLREMKTPKPAQGEALIQVRYAGICNTDREIFQGYLSFKGIPGHEFVGEVVKGPRRWLGKRVVGEINLACGKCAYGRAGLKRHCPRRSVLGIAGKNGAFAEYLTLPVANLHQVPRSVHDYEAVLVEPLAAALRILDQVPIRKDQPVWLLGDGKLAQLIARAVRLKTKNLTMVGKHEEKLARVKYLGIKTRLVSQLGKMDPLKKPELVIEATGDESGLQLALKICKPFGTIVLKSTFHAQPRMDLSKLVVDELHLIGSRCGDFRKALKLLAQRKIYVRDQVGKVYELEDFAAAFKKAASRTALKVLFRCQK
jgi:threonine dehydrogenase-like Zn-dependent dehydrogenase